MTLRKESEAWWHGYGGEDMTDHLLYNKSTTG
jgi:hypothetical protein